MRAKPPDMTGLPTLLDLLTYLMLIRFANADSLLATNYFPDSTWTFFTQVFLLQDIMQFQHKRLISSLLFELMMQRQWQTEQERYHEGGITTLNVVNTHRLGLYDRHGMLSGPKHQSFSHKHGARRRCLPETWVFDYMA